jgi:hypothetical protein
VVERPHLNVFISSPSDVLPERKSAERVVERLAREFASDIAIAPILWEREPLRASEHFQKGLIAPSETDIVVVVLWSRLGVLLPVDQHPGPVSRKPVTGTEWEFEDALASFRARAKPDLLVYKKDAEILTSLTDEAKLEASRTQKRLVDNFFEQWFVEKESGSLLAAFHRFETTVEFESILETHLRKLLILRLGHNRQDLTDQTTDLVRPYLPHLLTAAVAKIGQDVTFPFAYSEHCAALLIEWSDSEERSKLDIDRVSRLLNSLVSELTDIVISQGGDIVELSTDRTVAIWVVAAESMANITLHALHCATLISDHLRRHQTESLSRAEVAPVV